MSQYDKMYHKEYVRRVQLSVAELGCGPDNPVYQCTECR